MKDNSHSAVGPALGYYYQAIFALICLLDSKNDKAFISIETFDDVYHEDGSQKNLHQLKHKTVTNSKISMKSDDLWKTLKVWCDFIKLNDPNEGIFTLSTVATVDKNSPLNILKSETGSRIELERLLLEEAKRVMDEREEARIKNLERIESGQKEEKIPHELKYKGCEAFQNLPILKRQSLIKKIRINTETFSIDKAQREVIKRIKISTQSENYRSLAESIIAWWDREAVKSLTREREDCIFFSELQGFISKKIMELYNDGFTDDIDDLELPLPDSSHPVHLKQLEIINASTTQRRRSFNTEVKARIQRQKWMDDKLSAASKLIKYDEELIEQWDYKFCENVEKSELFQEDQKQEEGRKLLDWSHEEAHKQVRSISKNYNNPDLIRGSYQVLSKDKRVGWHCDFGSLIKGNGEDE